MAMLVENAVVQRETRKINKGGRPPKTPEQRRTKRVEIWFSDNEYKQLNHICERSGLHRADLIRSLVFNKKVQQSKIPAINKEAYAELGRIGNNINQALKLANRYGGSEPNKRAFAELYELLHRVRLDLLGVSDDS